MKWYLFQTCKDGSTSVNQCDINKRNDTNHVIISIDVEKSLNKIQYLFMTKPLNKMSMKETYLKIIKAIYDKSTDNIILSGEKLNDFPIRS